MTILEVTIFALVIFSVFLFCVLTFLVWLVELDCLIAHGYLRDRTSLRNGNSITELSMFLTIEESRERTDGDWGVVKVTRTVRIFGIRVATNARLQYLDRR